MQEVGDTVCLSARTAHLVFSVGPNKSWSVLLSQNIRHSPAGAGCKIGDPVLECDYGEQRAYPSGITWKTEGRHSKEVRLSKTSDRSQIVRLV